MVASVPSGIMNWAARAFGFSAFGPLKFRSVNGSVAGDWQPLATLVRLPALKELLCPEDLARACKLSGNDLFLVEAVAGNPQFEQAVVVSHGFPGATLPVPHPTNGRLYVKLRDEPDTVNLITLKAQVLPPAPEETSAETPAPAAEAAAPAPATAAATAQASLASEAGSP